MIEDYGLFQISNIQYYVNTFHLTLNMLNMGTMKIGLNMKLEYKIDEIRHLVEWINRYLEKEII